MPSASTTLLQHGRRRRLVIRPWSCAGWRGMMVSFAMLWLLASRGKDGVERICRVALLACQIRLGVSAMGVECVAPVCKGGGKRKKVRYLRGQKGCKGLVVVEGRAWACGQCIGIPLLPGLRERRRRHRKLLPSTHPLPLLDPCTICLLVSLFSRLTPLTRSSCTSFTTDTPLKQSLPSSKTTPCFAQHHHLQLCNPRRRLKPILATSSSSSTSSPKCPPQCFVRTLSSAPLPLLQTSDGRTCATPVHVD